MAKTKKPFNRSAYAAAKSMATEVTGYNTTSPIWGKRLPEVLEMIENSIRDAGVEMNSGEYAQAQQYLTRSYTYIEEMKKRLAKQAIINTQTH